MQSLRNQVTCMGIPPYTKRNMELIHAGGPEEMTPFIRGSDAYERRGYLIVARPAKSAAKRLSVR